MSEGSLPPSEYLKLRRYPGKLRDAAGRLIGRLRRGKRRGGTPEPRNRAADPPRSGPGAGEVGEAAQDRAAALLREFLAENATNVERASRRREQAERLEREGTPSDSARNRAERAGEEVADGLSRLVRSLSASGEHETARALEAETQKLDPSIRPSGLRR